MDIDYNEKDWATPCPKYDCKKTACKCGLEYVNIPASLGDDSEGSNVAPKNGAYCNALVFYEDNGHVYIYSKEGIPTLIDVDASDISVLEQEVIKAQKDVHELREDIDDFIYGFDTVAQMKAATNLKSGDIAKTLGYHAKNDGGGAEYKIRNISNGDIVDEATIINMSNSLVAELILGDVIEAKQFGCYGDDSHDDTVNLQKAFDYVQNKNGVLLLNPGIYKITDSLTITHGFKLIGTYNAGATNTGYLGSEIYQHGANKNLINFTTNNIYNMQIKDIRFKGNGGRGLSVDGIFFSEFTFEHLIFNGSFTDAIYLDHATIGKISDSAFSANAGGMNLKNVSGILFSNLNFWINSNYGIKFGTVSGCVFVRVWMENTAEVPYPNLLFQAPCNVGNLVFEECGLSTRNAPNIKIDYITNITDIMRLVKVTFSNCTFDCEYECSILINNDDGDGNRNSHPASYTSDVTFENCRARLCTDYMVKTDYRQIHWILSNCSATSAWDTGTVPLTNSYPNLIMTRTINYLGSRISGGYALDENADNALLRKDMLFLRDSKLKWRDHDNANSHTVSLIRKGDTAGRPGADEREIGSMYFDTTLGKPVWFTANNDWRDAAGNIV